MKDQENRQREIVVGLDGSPESAHALSVAIDLARALGGRIAAVYAMPPPSALEYGADYGPMPPPELDPEWRAEVTREFAEDWCRALEKAGVPYSTVVEDGRAAAVIAEVAESRGAYLVVVGRRGRGEVAELLLGSVSHELSHHCRRPVLLVSGTEAADGKDGAAGAPHLATSSRSTSSSDR